MAKRFTRPKQGDICINVGELKVALAAIPDHWQIRVGMYIVNNAMANLPCELVGAADDGSETVIVAPQEMSAEQLIASVQNAISEGN